MAFGTLRNGIWDPTQWHLGTYAMAFGNLRNGIWDPTQWHLGPYAIAFGTLRNGIWDPTQWHWVQPCRQVRTASSDRRVELKPSLTPAREALVRIIENPTGVFQWFSAFVSVKIRVSAKITRTAWRHRGDETWLSFTSAVPESCVR